MISLAWARRLFLLQPDSLCMLSLPPSRAVRPAREEFREMFDHSLYYRLRNSIPNCLAAFPEVYDKVRELLPLRANPAREFCDLRSPTLS